MLGPILLLALIPPQTEASPSARERLDALIESTNALEHFRAEYEVIRHGSAGRLTIDYAAPGSIRVHGGSEKGSMDSGCADGFLWMNTVHAEKGSFWAQVDMLDRGGEFESVLAQLREPYWLSSGGPEASVGVSWGVDDETDRMELSVLVGPSFVNGQERNVLLGWLRTLSQADGELELDDTELTHRDRGVSCCVDAKTGFLKELVLSSDDGGEVRLVLQRLDLGFVPTDDDFARPDRSPGSEDASELLRDSLLTRRHLRLHALRQVQSSMVSEGRDLDDEAQVHLRSFLAALYLPMVEASFEEFSQDVRQKSQEFADWVRSSLDAGRSRKELIAAIDERRTSLEQQAERARPLWMAQLEDREALPDSASWPSIRALEDEVLVECFDAALTKPILDDFDARADEALDP